MFHRCRNVVKLRVQPTSVRDNMKAYVLGLIFVDNTEIIYLYSSTLLRFLV